MNNFSLKRILLLVLFYSFNLACYSQERVFINSDGDVKSLSNSEEGRIATFQYNGISRQKVIQSEEEHQSVAGNHYIVLFNEKPPLLKLNMNENRNSARTQSTSNDRIAELKAFFQQHNTSSRARNSSATVQQSSILKGYERAIYGAHVEMSLEAANEVRKLDFVRSVRPVRRYEAILQESVPLIRADEFWQSYQFTGSGIVVGIIDTGIDYTHPDLGNGFGPGFKVKGGYDFVNQDEDPMDDHFHGTHVAGIVAGNGSIMGVAPDASLMALKVLDQHGGGYENTIIEAIEWSLDPNGDGNFEDKLDVVNMSLGGPGGPEDPMSMAVNNAVEAGVVYCIAAGNNYTNFSIGSPGNAELAITVGASDNFNELGFFTSKGPNNDNYHIKPDILAPGVNIHSSMLNGSYDQLSGTSMAAPHAAGMAALLLGINPNLDPPEIKSAMASTAVDLGFDVMSQGSGRIDVMAAASITSYVNPSNLSFGLNDIESDQWEKTRKITISNKSTKSQNYNVNIPEVVAGLSIQVDKTNFTLAAGASTELEFNLTVDNNEFVLEPNPSMTYSDFISIIGETDDLKIPWAFVSGSMMTISLDNWGWKDDFYLIGESNFYSSWDYQVQENEVTILVAPGIYDLYVMKNFAQYVIVKEHVAIERTGHVEAFTSDATNKITLYAEDENGNPLSQRNASSNLRLETDNFSLGFSDGTALIQEYYFSEFSDRFNLKLKTLIAPTKPEDTKIYDINYGLLKGLKRDTTLVVTQNDLTHAELVMNPFTPDTLSWGVVFDTSFQFDQEGELSDWFGFGYVVENILHGHWTLDLYATEQVIDDFNRKMGIMTMVSKGSTTEQGIYEEVLTPNISVIDGYIGVTRSTTFKPGAAKFETDSRLEFGNGLLHLGSWFGQYEFHPRGPHGEVMNYGPSGYLESAQDGKKISYSANTYYDWNSSNGKVNYILETNSENYELLMLPTSLQLINEQGVHVSRLGESTTGSIAFSIDHQPSMKLSTTKAFSRIHGSEDYQELELDEIARTSSRMALSAGLPDQLEDEMYDFKIEVATEDGESMSWILEPAFIKQSNKPPEIVGQNNILRAANQPYTFDMNDVEVNDADNIYPVDFQLNIHEGANFEIQDKTIIPHDGFSGQLSVPITVSDGKNSSEIYNFIISILNKDAPVITGQSTKESWRHHYIEISLNDLIIDLPGGKSTEDLTLRYLPGNDYFLNQNGLYVSKQTSLTINLLVNDGELDSEVFPFVMEVKNYVPKIIGHEYIEIEKGSIYRLKYDDLYIDDQDDYFHIFHILDGPNYSHSGPKIIPDPNFSGTLKVSLIASDYIDDSEKFDLSIQVTSGIPVIDSQKSIPQISRSETFTLSLDELNVVDSDNNFPEDFTLEVLNGSNYTFEEGLTIIPDPAFAGQLSVRIRVSDGVNLSGEFNYLLDVINYVPRILSQKSITIGNELSYELKLDDLEIDEQDPYDQNRLELIMHDGDHYSLSQTTIHVSSEYSGSLVIPIQVTDGYDDSDYYDLKVDVEKDSDIVTGLSNELTGIKLYPNPVKQKIYMDLPEQQLIKYEIVDLSGAVLLAGALNYDGQHSEIDLSTLTQGMYVVHLTNGHSKISKKIIKQ